MYGLLFVWLFPLLYSTILVVILRNDGITSDPFENGDSNCLFVHTVSPGLVALPVSLFACAFLAVYIVSKQKQFKYKIPFLIFPLFRGLRFNLDFMLNFVVTMQATKNAEITKLYFDVELKSMPSDLHVFLSNRHIYIL